MMVLKNLFVLFWGFLPLWAKVTESEYGLMPAIFHLDNYEKCMEVKSNSLYCSFTYKLMPINKENSSIIWNIIHEVSTDVTNYRHDLLRHKICTRETCPKATNGRLLEGINQCYNEKFQHLGLHGIVSHLKCITANSVYPVRTIDIIVARIAGFYVLFVAIASLVEGRMRYKDKKEYNNFISTRVGWFLSMFSIPKNYYRLVGSNNDPDAVKLKSIQGVRTFLMVFVIGVHTGLLYLKGPISNPQFTENIRRNSLFLYLLSTPLFVQIFFLITAWLLTFNYLHFIEKYKHAQTRLVILGILNRVLRFLPTVGIVVVFHCTWFAHLGNGPLWDEYVIKEHNSCKKKWWSYLLFVNNLVEIDNNHECLIQMWYLAADTQLFIITLLCFAVIWRYSFLGKYFFVMGHILGFGIPAIMAYTNQFDAIMKQTPEIFYELKTPSLATFKYMYVPWYNNIGGWMMGITFGYFYYHYKNMEVFKKKIYEVFWWFFIWPSYFLVVSYGFEIYKENYQYDPVTSALYWSLSKPAIAFLTGIVIYGFTQQIGWYFRWLAEWSVMEVLGRLSYSTYLVHLTVLYYRIGMGRSLMYMNCLLCFFDALGDVVASFFCGFLVTLFVELPISGILKGTNEIKSDKTD